MQDATIAGYSLIRKIGSGGSSEVWLAEKDGKKYAIKTPKIDAYQTVSKKDVAEFLEKAKLWAALDHPNIVRVYEFGVNPIPFIIMEYCTHNLRSIISNLSKNMAIVISIKVADALNYAHNYGIIHRDIKPENILFVDNEPKIGDWDIAKVLLKVTATQTKYVGTPLYSAPEQLDPKDFGFVDWRTDIWQFGCLLYEMFAKEPPFFADFPGQLAISILKDEPTWNRNIPEGIRDILLKCLKKNKEERWQNIGIILEQLKQYKAKVRVPKEKEIVKKIPKVISKEEVKKLIEEGDKFFFKGQYLEAIEYYNRALDIDPNNAIALYYIGDALDNLGHHEMALEYYDKALKIDPRNSNIWNNRGLALDNLGRYEEALECYNKALKIKPNDDRVLYNKAIALRKLRRYKEALKCYDKALEINPNDADIWNNKGVVFNELKQYKKAIECFNKALKIDPNHEKARKNKKATMEKLRKRK